MNLNEAVSVGESVRPLIQRVEAFKARMKRDAEALRQRILDFNTHFQSLAQMKQSVNWSAYYLDQLEHQYGIFEQQINTAITRRTASNSSQPIVSESSPFLLRPQDGNIQGLMTLPPLNQSSELDDSELQCAEPPRTEQHNSHSSAMDSDEHHCLVRGCTESFQNSNQLRDHLYSAHGKQTNWPCGQCVLYFADYGILCKHFTDSHSQKQDEPGTVTNPFEDTSGPSDEPLGAAVDDHQPNDVPQQASSSRCVRKRSRDELVQAEPVAERDKMATKCFIIQSLKCFADDCQQICSTRQALNDHLKRVHGVERYYCAVRGCRKSFQEMKQKTDHQKRDHAQAQRQSKWPCGRCAKEFSTYHDLIKHFWPNHLEGQFACPIDGCGFVAHTPRKMYNHRHRIHFRK